MSVFFTSDTHFGHYNAIRYDNRPYKSIEEMDEDLICRWNEKVGKDDLVYHLGDVSWYKDDYYTYKLLSRLNGKIELIFGNHDGNLKAKSLSRFESVHHVQHKIKDKASGTRIILSHAPILFDQDALSSVNFYGHVHIGCDYEYVKRYVNMMRQNCVKCVMHNVGCMCWDFAPATFEEIIKSKK